MIKVKNGELYQLTKRQPVEKKEQVVRQVADFPLIESPAIPQGFFARQVGEHVWLLDEANKLRACERTLSSAIQRLSL